jgi:membrane protein involved in colicin uptake
MYWREIYPNHAAAARAERLGDLGKVKLDATQKAAIRAAKADAKVKAAQAKAAEKIAKITRKTQIRDAKASAKVAKYNVNAALAQSDAAALALPSADFASQSTMPSISFSSGGGGGLPAFPSTADAAPAESGVMGIPLPALLLGAGLLIFLVMKR